MQKSVFFFVCFLFSGFCLAKENSDYCSNENEITKGKSYSTKQVISCIEYQDGFLTHCNNNKSKNKKSVTKINFYSTKLKRAFDVF